MVEKEVGILCEFQARSWGVRTSSSSAQEVDVCALSSSHGSGASSRNKNTLSQSARLNPLLEEKLQSKRETFHYTVPGGIPLNVGRRQIRTRKKEGRTDERRYPILGGNGTRRK